MAKKRQTAKKKDKKKKKSWPAGRRVHRRKARKIKPRNTTSDALSRITAAGRRKMIYGVKPIKSRAGKIVRPLSPVLSGKKAEPQEVDGVKRTRIRVVGVGGGAGNIVSELASRLKKVSFVVANTDSQALKQLKKSVVKIQFGQSLTHGLGTGMNSELARAAAISEKERIKKLFEGYDLCILISCLGGGAGSGAAPVFAKLARNSGVLTLGVFTLPFKFEGEKKEAEAREALQQLKNSCNAIAVLPNDRIFQTIEKSTPLQEALSLLNKNLADSLEGLIETIYLPGLINIDFADLQTILHGQGRVAYLNSAKVQGAGGATEAVKQVLDSPLYPYTIKGAKRVLFNITGGKNLALSEVSEVSRIIFEQVFSQAQIIFGVSQGQKSHAPLKVFLLATGCQAKGLLESVKEEIKKPSPPKKKKARPRNTTPYKLPSATVTGLRPFGLRFLRPKAKPRIIRRSYTGMIYGARIKARSKPKPKPKPKGKAKPKPARIKLTVQEEKPEEKLRKNALQVKREAEVAEKELLEKEKFWEMPAFLRRQKT